MEILGYAWLIAAYGFIGYAVVIVIKSTRRGK
jgi:hypothetical protein